MPTVTPWGPAESPPERLGQSTVDLGSQWLSDISIDVSHDPVGADLEHQPSLWSLEQVDAAEGREQAAGFERSAASLDSVGWRGTDECVGRARGMGDPRARSMASREASDVLAEQLARNGVEPEHLRPVQLDELLDDVRFGPVRCQGRRIIEEPVAGCTTRCGELHRPPTLGGHGEISERSKVVDKVGPRCRNLRRPKLFGLQPLVSGHRH